jgi:glycine oxidase
VADAVVVGGGVIGLATARELARRGVSVVLVEAGEVGQEASHAAGGMLAPQSEADSADDFFRFQRASRDRFPSFADALRAESHWDVELDRTGTLYVGFTEADERELDARHAWQRTAGLAVERLTGDEARGLEPALSPRVRVALKFPEDWQVENRRLILALRESVEEHYGVVVQRATEVEGVRVRGGRVEGVETSRGFVAAGAVVLAAGARTSRVRLFLHEGDAVETTLAPHPRVVPVRGQMVSLAQPPSFLPAFAHVLYSPRGYLVPRRDGRLLAGSTTEDAGFNKVVTAEGLHTILANAMEIAPAAGEFDVTETWAGLRPRADDALPVIGESADVAGLFYATGHYRNGILLAPLTGEAIAALVAGDAGALAALPFNIESFSPARFRRAHANTQQG